MIITVDTSKDSHQDIKKLIKFLQHHIGESVYNNSLNDDVPTPTTGMFDMFGDNSSNRNDNTLSESMSLLDDDKKDEPKENISILPY